MLIREDYQHEWHIPAAAEPVVTVVQGTEEEGRDVREGLMRYLNSYILLSLQF